MTHPNPSDDLLCSVEVCPAVRSKAGAPTIGAEAHIKDRDDAEDISSQPDTGGYDV